MTRVYEVECDGVTAYVDAPTAAKARALAFRLAADARGGGRIARRDVFRGLRARRAVYVPPDATVYVYHGRTA